jgi:hypothetical protein
MALGARVLGVAAVAERCWPTAGAPAKAQAQAQAQVRVRARARVEEQLQLQLQLKEQAEERAQALAPILAEWQALLWVEALAL